MSQRIAVVDGANIAYIERSQKGDPKVANLLAVRAALENKGYRPLILVDASLVYEIDDRPQLEALIVPRIFGRFPPIPTLTISLSKQPRNRMRSSSQMTSMKRIRKTIHGSNSAACR